VIGIGGGVEKNIAFSIVAVVLTVAYRFLEYRNISDFTEGCHALGKSPYNGFFTGKEWHVP
jgi:hypothetical protein